MSEAVVWLTIFVLGVFVGIEVISKVSSTLHTPLMSGANAIHGVILLGAILVTGTDRLHDRAGRRAGRRRAGHGQHGRRLRGHRPDAADVHAQEAEAAARTARRVSADDADLGAARLPGLRGLLHPGAQGALLAADGPRRQSARRGRARSSAARSSFFYLDLDHVAPILVAIAVGTAVGVVGAQRVQMTQMPQMVALFNGVGGGAAALVALLELRAPSIAERAAGSTWPRPRSRSWSARSPSPARWSPSSSCRS